MRLNKSLPQFLLVSKSPTLEQIGNLQGKSMELHGQDTRVVVRLLGVTLGQSLAEGKDLADGLSGPKNYVVNERQTVNIMQIEARRCW